MPPLLLGVPRSMSCHSTTPSTALGTTAKYSPQNYPSALVLPHLLGVPRSMSPPADLEVDVVMMPLTCWGAQEASV